MGRSRWNQYNFTELERDKERIKQKKKNKNKKDNLRLTETKDYDYFKKYGTYRSGDGFRSLKEEALYKYFAYVD